ncbi:Hypothetical predicted protein, partial [Mytilus galloprovincialis]
MEIPLSVVLLLLFGVTSLKCSIEACGDTKSITCTTTVQTTCPTIQAQCSPIASCPVGFVVVANGNANKCYRVLETDAANYGAASVACATVGGSLFEPRTTAELNAVRAIIPT